MSDAPMSIGEHRDFCDAKSCDLTDDQLEGFIQEKINVMSLEEKVGQMTQLTLGFLLQDPFSDDPHIDKEKILEAISVYKVGSILESTFSGALTLEKWQSIVRQIQDAALVNEPCIPVLFGVDSIHGATYVKGSTLFPHNLALAASRNPQLVMQCAQVAAMETRASGVRWNFAPVLDLARNPLWPRYGETFGEDPYLVSEMGKAAICGYENSDISQVNSVATCLKHFVGYSCSDNGKDRTPASIAEIDLWEKHIPAFRKAIELGAPSVMINSASVNGVPVHASHYLLQTVLRDKLGFEGVVVSDWEDVIRLHTRHRVADSPREAVRIAVEAGIDMSMVPDNFSFCHYLIDLVKSGDIPESRIDQSVARILAFKMQLGLFDNAYPEPRAAEKFALSEYRDLALNAARQSVTLLKNENKTLPLKENTRILLAGPAANSLSALNGPWSFSWQGLDKDGYPERYQTLSQVLLNRLGNEGVVTMGSDDYDNDKNYDTRRLQQLACEVDVIILALGENAYAESPGVIDDLALAPEQQALAEAAIATGKPVVLLLAEGRPRIIRSIEPGMSAILQAYWPGSQGAEAIVDILLGKENPCGLLPYSYPRYSGDFVYYDRNFTADVQELVPGEISSDGYNPQWPFGFGLSYTQFEYSGLEIDHDVLTCRDQLEIKVSVSNVGQRSGICATDLFVSDLFASIAPSVKRLKGFQCVELEPGEVKTLIFRLTPDHLSFINSQSEPIIEPGEFKITVGPLAKNFFYKGSC